MMLGGLETAIRIAVNAHEGKRDKAGRHYILHPIRVMLGMETVKEKIVAVLHDTVEDSNIQVSEIHLWFSEEIGDAVDAISKRAGESKDEYYARIKANPLALKVKLADIRDNMDAERMNLLDAETRNRLFKKYDYALARLTNAPD